MPRVAVVTDSTASVPADLVRDAGLLVVPLDVVVGEERHVEGESGTAELLVSALDAGTPVSTSQPAPAAFSEVYAQAARAGAREIVSVHLSGELSGTFRAAELAALGAPVPVHLVDSRATGLVLGFAALAAAGTARVEPRRSGRGAVVAQRARDVAASGRVFFLVDSLEHLRRGGRLSAPAAALGTVLGMRPILTLEGGRIEVHSKVRTRRAARDRLVALGVEAAAGREAPRLAVHHLGQPDVAAEIAAQLADGVGVAASEVVISQISAVIGAHAGPGLLSVVVTDH